MKFDHLKMLVFLTLSILSLPIPMAIAGDVSLEPGYLVGQVRMGNADATFTTTSISTNASGGGYTAAKTTSNNSNYQLTVQGGDWYNTVTASANFNGTNSSPNTSNSSIYVIYNNRSVQVTPGESVTNDYVNTGVIKLKVNITGDASTRFTSPSYWYARKDTTANERTYTRFRPSNTALATHRDAYLYVPVAPNQGIAVTGSLDITCANGSQRFSFNKTVNVNSGETVEVPLDMNFVCPPPPTPGGGGGGGTPCTYYPLTIEGDVGLPGVQTADFNYTAFWTNKTLNPSPYTYTYSNLCNATSYTITPTATTYFKGNAEGTYRWPYLGGSSANNTVTLNKDYIVTKDYIGEAVPISGEIRYTGTVTNADLNQYTVNLTGEPKVYRNGAWVQNLPANYGSLSFTRHKTTNGYKRPAQLSYLNYLSPGDWYTGQWTAQKLITTPYRKQSDLNFTDYNNHYDGYTTYNFGTPVHIDSGVPKTKDFEYCMGSAIFRFRDVSGGLLTNPYVSGSGSHINSINKQDMIMSVTGTTTVSLNSAPEVEIFGPTGNYTLSTVRVVAQDNSTITFPPVSVALSCNTTKIFDIPGPTLIVSSPSGELITNAQSLPVTGRAFSGSTIQSVTVNSQSTTLSPITGGQNNEVSFTRDLNLVDGKNTVNIIATDVSGAQANDQIIVSVDRWIPTATITNGDRFANTETSIPFTVNAADRGYGYILQVYLDGVALTTVNGAANDTTTVPVAYSGTLTNITLGTHTITATATDLAGNTTTTTSTIEIYEARDNNPPVITRLGDAAVTIEAGYVYADAGATALDDRDGDITAAIIITNPVNNAQIGSYTVAYNVADAAGNAAAEVTRQVTVVDTTAPTLTVPSDKIVEATGVQTSVEIGQANASDIFAVTITNNAPAVFPLGTTIVVWTATDANGNVTTKEQKITVQDTTPPVVVVPGNIVLEAASSCSAPASFTATATDIVDAAPVVSCSEVSGSSFSLGTKTVTCTATDASGNSANDIFTITVQDTTAPALTVPADKTAEATGALTPVEISQATASDSCPPVTITNDAPLAYPLGTTIVIWTATDANGNVSTKEQKVTVQDTTPPAVVVPGNIALEAASSCSAPASFTATATDIVDAAPVVSCSEVSGSTFALGEKIVTCIATDASGNSANDSFTITVQDTTAPALTIPADKTAEATGALTPVEIGQATATDSCPPVTITDNAPLAYPLGTTIVIWTATDANGNVTTKEQKVTITDTTKPQISGVDQVLEATSPNGAVATYTVTASDNSGVAPSVTCSAASGSTFALGTNTVTCTATDKSSNSATGSFTIKVQDTIPPNLTVPATITVVLNTSTSAPAITAFLNGASAVDIVDLEPTITHTAVPSLNTVGEKVVTFTAVDDYNNSTIKTAIIKVVYGCGDTYLNNEETNFLTPVNLLKPFKLGSTIPVKLHLCDAGGADVMTAVARIYLQMFSNNEPVGDPIEVTSTSGADTGNYFRVSGSHYMYNLYTKSLTSGSYQIQAVLDDGTIRTIPLFLKQ